MDHVKKDFVEVDGSDFDWDITDKLALMRSRDSSVGIVRG
jgi:hypothetical protein